MYNLSPSELNLSADLLQGHYRSLYVTAPSEGAGSSSCAYALALALRELVNEPVLLIDGNFENPGLNNQFNLNEWSGFADWLRSDDQDPSDYICKVKNHEIHVMGTGQVAAEHPLRGLAEQIPERVKLLLEVYPYIVLDAPAINQSGSLNLAALFNGVILVAAENQTRIESLETAKQQLQQAGANLVGSILNRRRQYIPNWLSKLV